MEPLPQESKILNNLLKKADTKQHIYEKTIEAFALINKELEVVSGWIKEQIEKTKVKVNIHFKKAGEFESELKFAGDTLYFIMHTNVFTFPKEHFIYKTDYVKQDPERAYCGMILIYNFLSDSVKYNRINDLGYLLGRIFINKDGHYFIQGKRQYSFLHRDFANITISQKAIREIVEAAITHATEFELFAPPIEQMQQISLREKIEATGLIALKTAKRLGFDLDSHDHDFKMEKG